ncbi:uncharacterized protein LY89DRAFT_733946 [Mollisia scopiformis]|uniref:Uncharacterized protein n=1 Tax=Mollisia scopiformis TaxID=149040 RepID=A0A194X9V2_MOLSC|nr:uncharacterized protein LY89DRAFT_733946 [Mollisia scopiformis]KUJ16950.1 hypothetical protein LY89DRAFT_733946 [Mollisia scopiformis]
MPRATQHQEGHGEGAMNVQIGNIIITSDPASAQPRASQDAQTEPQRDLLEIMSGLVPFLPVEIAELVAEAQAGRVEEIVRAVEQQRAMLQSFAPTVAIRAENLRGVESQREIREMMEVSALTEAIEAEELARETMEASALAEAIEAEELAREMELQRATSNRRTDLRNRSRNQADESPISNLQWWLAGGRGPSPTRNQMRRMTVGSWR